MCVCVCVSAYLTDFVCFCLYCYSGKCSRMVSCLGMLKQEMSDCKEETHKCLVVE